MAARETEGPRLGFICCNYYRFPCRLLRIRVLVNGAPTRDRAADGSLSRKELTAQLERMTRRMPTETLRGVSFSDQPR